MVPSSPNHIRTQQSYNVTVRFIEIYYSELEIVWVAVFGSKIQATQAQFDALTIHQPTVVGGTGEN